ncbi:MAG: hypothetical protein H0V89_05435 [Deltaproteobacteria bacterium]|nr:hypothetical protein [Deltaproteobacteria bacterium]
MSSSRVLVAVVVGGTAIAGGASCGGERVLPAGGEQGLKGVEDAMAASLMGANCALIAVDTDAARRGAAPPVECPAIEVEGTDTEFTADVDFGSGCEPADGLIQVEMAGALHLDFVDPTLTVTFDSLTANGVGVDGLMVGSYSGSLVSGLDVVVESELTFIGLDEATFTQSLTAVIGTGEVTIDGDTSISGDATLTTSFAGVSVRYVDAGEACVVPYAGTATATVDGDTVEVRFFEDSPSTGLVDLVYGGVVYEVEFCPTLY